MKEMEGPELANSGEIVTFICRYDLGKDAIYSIKWYKEDRELYRYIPTDNPEYRIFPGTPGLIVMVRKPIYSKLKDNICRINCLIFGQFFCTRSFNYLWLIIYFQENATVPNRLVAKMDGPFGSGVYRCEITIETPLFVTLDVSKNMTVIGIQINQINIEK